MQSIVITGITTADGAATEVTIENEPPISAIVSAELIVASHNHSATTGDATHAACTVTGAVYGSATSLGTFVTSIAAANAARKALTVVHDTPDADGEIQLTDVNKFKLYLTTGMTADDILILKVSVVGEYMRP